MLGHLALTLCQQPHLPHSVWLDSMNKTNTQRVLELAVVRASVRLPRAPPRRLSTRWIPIHSLYPQFQFQEGGFNYDPGPNTQVKKATAPAQNAR